MTKHDYVVTVRAVFVARIRIQATSAAEAKRHALEQARADHECDVVDLPRCIDLSATDAHKINGSQ